MFYVFACFPQGLLCVYFYETFWFGHGRRFVKLMRRAVYGQAIKWCPVYPTIHVISKTRCMPTSSSTPTPRSKGDLGPATPVPSTSSQHTATNHILAWGLKPNRAGADALNKTRLSRQTGTPRSPSLAEGVALGKNTPFKVPALIQYPWGGPVPCLGYPSPTGIQ